LVDGSRVVEVHLMWLQALAAVLAWNAAKVAQEVDGRTLPADDAIDLALSIPLVVEDVVGPLIRVVGIDRRSTSVRAVSMGP
jgi:hypothetical protein